MAWIFFQESVESPSHSSPGSERLLTASKTLTPKVFSCRECGKAFLIALPSGTTCGPCQLDISGRPSTSSPAAFLARTFRLRAMALAWRESVAVFSSRSLDSLESSSQLSFFSKTFPQSEPEEFAKLSGHLPSFGMTVAGRLYRPPMLGPRTYANDGSCLRGVPTATATATDAKSSRNLTVKNRNSKGNPGVTLTDYVTLFPTPSASASASGTNQGGGAGRKGKIRPSLETMARKNLWPTPTAATAATAAKGSRTPEGAAREMSRTQGPDLTTVVQVRSPMAGGQLSPRWVEWLMGFPIEWTALDALETQSFRSKRGLRSKDSSESEASA